MPGHKYDVFSGNNETVERRARESSEELVQVLCKLAADVIFRFASSRWSTIAGNQFLPSVFRRIAGNRNTRIYGPFPANAALNFIFIIDDEMHFANRTVHFSIEFQPRTLSPCRVCVRVNKFGRPDKASFALTANGADGSLSVATEDSAQVWFSVRNSGSTNETIELCA